MTRNGTLAAATKTALVLKFTANIAEEMDAAEVGVKEYSCGSLSFFASIGITNPGFRDVIVFKIVDDLRVKEL